MKTIAAVHVDLHHAPMGTRSLLAENIAGEPVLRRTAMRLLKVARLQGVHLLTPADQVDGVRAIVSGLDVKVESHRAGAPPYAALVRAGRWWGLDSWRGGVGGLTVFDEDMHVELLHALASQEHADAVLCVPAAACVVDSAMLDAMIQHHAENTDTTRLTFAQAPPGLSALMIQRSVLEELAPTGQPPGVLFGYHPDRPMPDLTGKEACFRPSVEIIEASGRLLADTRRGFDRIRDLIACGGGDWDARQIAQWLNERRANCVEPVPAEIEIELTSDDPLPNSIIRPRGLRVGNRGPIRQSAIHAILESFAGYDDVRIVLGGFGEPCLHPALPELCTMLRAHPSVAAIAVRASGLFSPDQQRQAEAAEAALFEAPVDVVEVMIDAATAETYRRVHGFDGFEQVVARLERWIARREQRQQVRPLIVPSFVKAQENVEDMEAFFDRWQGRLGTALITGYTHCAGQLLSLAVSSMTPPVRGNCRRVLSRVVVLADGRVTTCDQDFLGNQSPGVVGRQAFGELWKSPLLDSIRGGRIAEMPLCPSCSEWHRP